MVLSAWPLVSVCFSPLVGQLEVFCSSDEAVAGALPLRSRTLSGDAMLPFVFELSRISFPAMRGRITASAALLSHVLLQG